MTDYEYQIRCTVKGLTEEDAHEKFLHKYGLSILQHCDKYDVFKILSSGFRSLIKQSKGDEE